MVIEKKRDIIPRGVLAGSTWGIVDDKKRIGLNMKASISVHPTKMVPERSRPHLCSVPQTGIYHKPTMKQRSPLTPLGRDDKLNFCRVLYQHGG